MRLVGVLCVVGVMVLVTACGNGSALAQRQAARFAIAYVDHDRNGCCTHGLHAFAPKVAISSVDERWATVRLHARDKTGYDMGAEEFVLYRGPHGWRVFNGPAAGYLGCDVPKPVAAELELAAHDCQPPGELPAWVDCSYDAPTVEPSILTIACGHGYAWIDVTQWATWSRREAAGTGTSSYNDCKPNCAVGHIVPYPVAIDLAVPRSCGKKSLLQFTRLVVRRLGRNSATVPRRSVYRSPCRRP